MKFFEIFLSLFFFSHLWALLDLPLRTSSGQWGFSGREGGTVASGPKLNPADFNQSMHYLAAFVLLPIHCELTGMFRIFPPGGHSFIQVCWTGTW